MRPRGKGELDSERIQNPHDPDATYSVKGQGQRQIAHVGYKVQIAESVEERSLEPGEPTAGFVVGVVTQQAHRSDEAGAEEMAREQAAMELAPPPVLYADGAYVPAEKLAEAAAQGVELMGPAQSDCAAVRTPTRRRTSTCGWSKGRQSARQEWRTPSAAAWMGRRHPECSTASSGTRDCAGSAR